MGLAKGTRLGPYEIVECIGAGGMGEVYKARDTRLERTVAIKVSSSAFNERFQREAQAIASLNHPHICTLHDVGPEYLVMEFIDGTEIKGPLPVAEALRMAIQIAEALSYAHRNGVIHRDLKPGNILVTKAGIKVLDFGLAKLTNANTTSTPDATQLALTQQGAIMGTPRYMAPEQFEGKEADRRTDIFAFGLVIYELLAGRPAFDGKTQANLIAAVLAAEPASLTSTQPLIPPALDHLIRTCLEKDPDNRRQDMHDVLLELKWIAQGPPQTQAVLPAPDKSTGRRWLGWAAAAVLGVVAGGAAMWTLREAPVPVRPIRFTFAAPPLFVYVRSVDLPALSPDGQTFAFVGEIAGLRRTIWLRRLDALDAVALPGTDNAGSPFWSPDGKQIAYFAEGKLYRMAATGGPSQLVTETAFSSGAWGADNMILLGNGNGPLHRVPASGGQPVSLLTLDAKDKERGQVVPSFLPDGRSFLYTSLSDARPSSIRMGSTSGTTPRPVVGNAFLARYSGPGHLVFARGTALLAQGFDWKRGTLHGEPFPISGSLNRGLGSTASFAASANGTIVYRQQDSLKPQLRMVERTGGQIANIAEPLAYRQFALAPDEKRVAAQLTSSSGDDLWLVDLSTTIVSRLTSEPGTEDPPVWTPDGKALVYGRSGRGKSSIHRRAVGGGEEQQILKGEPGLYPAQITKDGTMLYHNLQGKQLFLLPPGRQTASPVFSTSYAKDAFRLSPDEKWVTYSTNESGRWEVYIASFPGFTDRRQISNGGGVQGQWRKDAKELFYLSLEGSLMAVPVNAGPALETGAPKPLFKTRIPISPTADQYAVLANGQRFLVIEALESEAKPYIVMVNWAAGLGK